MDQLLAALKAAAEPTRLRILAICARAELTVSELTLVLGQSQPRVSRHLKLLCAAGLLTRHPEGAWVFYRLTDRMDGGSGQPGGGQPGGGQPGGVQPGGAQPGSALTQALVRLVPADDAVVQRDLARLEAVRNGRAEAAGEYFRANAAHWSQIRSLHVDEAEVERALQDIVGEAPVGDFLDIGTGTGRMLEIFGPGARRAIGFDMSREMLGYARSALEQAGLINCQVRLGDMYGVPLGAGSADTIMYHQVLHFADDPSAAIGEGARLLRPGGRLIVVDFLPHDQEQLRDAHAHRRLGFADQEVARWFRAVGLTPEGRRHLPGTSLTVGIWTARAPAAREAGASVPADRPAAAEGAAEPADMPETTDQPAADNAGGSVTYLSKSKVREAAS